MGDADTGRWIDDPPLPPLAPPPASLIHVHDLDNPNPRLRGHTEMVVIAWAPIPDGGIAALCAWLAGWHAHGPHGGRTTGRGRFAWCRLLEDRVEAWRPPHRYLDGDSGWHGLGEPGEVSEAIVRAVATLPERLREAALTPMPGDPSGSGDADNPNEPHGGGETIGT